MNIIDKKLSQLQLLVDDGMSVKNLVKAFEIIGITGYDEESASTFRLWNDYMPLELQYDERRRNLHILWECVDRTPWGINCAFAIPFRQILAQKLFKK